MPLSKDAFQRAESFVKTHARELDQQLFKFLFNGASGDGVLKALRRYQNKNGGFGHGLEPDFRTPASSPMATSVALQYCVAVAAPEDHPVVTKSMKYLLRTFDSGAGYWPATFMDVNQAPHAPWWHLASPGPPKEENWPNPSAELLGYLYAYPRPVPKDFRATVKRRAEVNLAFDNHMRGGPHRLYNLLCWQRALPYLPDDLGDKVRPSLAAAALERKPLTHEKLWELRIPWLAPDPEAPFAEALPEDVRRLMGDEIERQAPDGGWYPTWEWGQYPEAWAEARLEWAGKLTVETLHALRAFELIER
ncbi:MAG: hypothetical protein ACK2UP_05665 [Candidatus Promineifilaceae bacterium]|jgi:hypothetical protein